MGGPTTLGRGGSDFSASILAAALDASELWIWTDVDGIMSADPRLVPDAEVLAEVTYAEAAELAYDGAKVLHPRTLAPLAEKKIPVWSKNSFAPEKPGTKIVPAISVANGARAVTSMANVALVSLEPASPELSGVQVMARALDAVARANVEVLLFSSSELPPEFLLPGARGGAGARRCRRWNRRWRWNWPTATCTRSTWTGTWACWRRWAKACRANRAWPGRIFTAISRVQVNIIAIAQGSSELTIAVVVRRDGLEKAVRAVHAECGLGRP